MPEVAVIWEDRLASEKVKLAGLLPLGYGVVAGLGAALSVFAYVALVALGVLGGIAAGGEHGDGRSAAVRGALAGAAFAAGVVVVDAVVGIDGNGVHDPAVDMVLPSIVVGGLLGVIGHASAKGRTAR